MSIILKAENISKQYRLGTVGTGTINDDLKRWWYKIRGQEDPFLKIGAVNDRSSYTNEDYVWALRDINFEVIAGEVLGIIGKNGAGKSTLLKLLSRVTSPTTGSIRTRGRIASLLEVGTGFHGELTGRENIFMNGAVLGMTKMEIKSKLEEIISFSGCERYIDTPVKRYSSGMTVRLGFAVAAHLEPEILVVDEVLAVGDAEFQKKAIGKMQDLSTGEGRTVLFVSHNMASISSLCNRLLVLSNGELLYNGSTYEGINQYLNAYTSTSERSLKDVKNRKGLGEVKIIDILFFDKNGNNITILRTGQEVVFRVFFQKFKNEIFLKSRLSIAVSRRGKSLILLSSEIGANQYFTIKEDGYIDFRIPKFPLTKSAYKLDLFLETDGQIQDWIEEVCEFNVEDDSFYSSGISYPNGWEGKTVLIDYSFSLKQG